MAQEWVMTTAYYWGKPSYPRRCHCPWSKAYCNLVQPANIPRIRRRESIVKHLIPTLWGDEEGQDVAEYSVMMAVILAIIVGTIHLIGGNANNIFSAVASTIPQ
jgi:Flp pilus assembly pilin Flp